MARVGAVMEAGHGSSPLPGGEGQSQGKVWRNREIEKNDKALKETWKGPKPPSRSVHLVQVLGSAACRALSPRGRHFSGSDHHAYIRFLLFFT